MPELYIYKSRTQQNKNFVAFEGDICYNISQDQRFHDVTRCNRFVLCYNMSLHGQVYYL